MRRKAIGKRLRATLRKIRERLLKDRHWSIREQGRWLRQVVRGWLQYHAIPDNWARLRTFHNVVNRHWLRALRRRSQRSRMTWERFRRVCAHWIPRLKVLHPWPDVSFDAKHPR